MNFSIRSAILNHFDISYLVLHLISYMCVCSVYRSSQGKLRDKRTGKGKQLGNWKEGVGGEAGYVCTEDC